MLAVGMRTGVRAVGDAMQPKWKREAVILAGAKGRRLTHGELGVWIARSVGLGVAILSALAVTFAFFSDWYFITAHHRVRVPCTTRPALPLER